MGGEGYKGLFAIVWIGQNGSAQCASPLILDRVTVHSRKRLRSAYKSMLLSLKKNGISFNLIPLSLTHAGIRYPYTRNALVFFSILTLEVKKMAANAVLFGFAIERRRYTSETAFC